MTAAIVGLWRSVQREGPRIPSRSPRLWASTSSALGRHHRLAVEMALEVAAGAEGVLSGAGQDRDQRLLVVAEPGPGIDELAVGLGADRVHPLGAVDRDHRDRAAPLVANLLVLHRSPSIRSGPRRRQRGEVGLEARVADRRGVHSLDLDPLARGEPGDAPIIAIR